MSVYLALKCPDPYNGSMWWAVVGLTQAERARAMQQGFGGDSRIDPMIALGIFAALALVIALFVLQSKKKKTR